MNRTLTLMNVILTCCLMTGCDGLESPYPAESVKIENFLQYGLFNDYVKTDLKSHTKGILPESLPDDAAIVYRYIYQCDFGGLPCYSIYLSIDLKNDDDMSNEITRLTEVAGGDVESYSLGNDIYLLTGDEEQISELLNDHILDGMAYTFEIVKINEMQIEYFVLSQWEGQNFEDKETFVSMLSE